MAIDNPKDTIQYGGQVAAPIVGTIIGDSLRALGVEKRENQIEKELTWPDEPLVEVPDMLGRTRREIHDSYYELQINTSGEGKYVVTRTNRH